MNATSNELIRQYDAFQMGNDRILLSVNALLRKLTSDIPFSARIIKISGKKALINAGRRSGVSLKSEFVILTNQDYEIEINRSKLIYRSEDIKGKAIVKKVDENISEVELSGQDYFKDIDLNDLAVYR
jgi:hypothetical protein